MEKIRFYFFWLAVFMIGVFVLQNVLTSYGFTESYALNFSAIDNFEVWRFVTSIFLHGSLSHLIYNLFALLLFGFILERLIGSNKFLFVFLSSGIIANLIAVNFYNSSLGASGAIYGIIGAIIILRPMMMVWAFGLMIPMFVAGILWVIGDVMGVFGFGDAGVGNIAHLGGIFVGLLLGILFRFISFQKKRINEKIRIPEDVVNSWERVYMKN